MEVKIVGLIAVGKFPCSGCGHSIKYPAKYGYGYDSKGNPFRLCEDCCRDKGYLRRKKDEKGREDETFLF